MPPSRHTTVFWLVFTAFALLSLWFAVDAKVQKDTWVETYSAVGQVWGRLLFAAIGATYILVEGYFMLAELFRRQRFEEGQKLEREKWVDWRRRLEDWERRRDAANANGDQFSEPRPDPPA